LPPLDSVKYQNLLPWIIEHQVHLMLSPNYIIVVNPIVNVSFRRYPIAFTIVNISKHCTSVCDIFRCGEFADQTPILLLISSKFPFPMLSFKISSLTMKFHNFSELSWKNYWMHIPIPCRRYPSKLKLYLCWAWTFRKLISHQQPLNLVLLTMYHQQTHRLILWYEKMSENDFHSTLETWTRFIYSMNHVIQARKSFTSLDWPL
jgi:hypothetical protein